MGDIGGHSKSLEVIGGHWWALEVIGSRWRSLAPLAETSSEKNIALFFTLLWQMLAKEETINFQMLLELLKLMFEIKTHQTRFASGFVKEKTWCTFCTFGFFS